MSLKAVRSDLMVCHPLLVPSRRMQPVEVLLLGVFGKVNIPVLKSQSNLHIQFSDHRTNHIRSLYLLLLLVRRRLLLER